MAQLSPFPKFRALDSNGDPLAGGKLYSFEAGTSTPKATFTDQGAGTPNANPTILDPNGEADIWYDGNYKLQLDDSGDVNQWTIDNIEQFATTLNNTLSPAVDASAFQLEVSGTINEAASGTHVLLGGVRIQPPTINAGGGAVTEAVSLYVSAAPSAVGATNLALHVDAGPTQLDGTLTVGGNTTLSGTLDVAGITTVTNDLRIERAGIPILVIQDTGTAVDNEVQGLVQILDSTGATMAQVGMASATDGNVEVLNNISGGNIELTTTAGAVQVTAAAPLVQLVDTDAASDAAVTAQIHLGRTADLDLGVLGFTAADDELELTNNISGGNIELKTTAGQVHVLDAAPVLWLIDTDAGTNTEVTAEVDFGRAGSVAGRVGFLSASDVVMNVTNTLTGGDLEFQTNSGDFVFVTLPASDPTKAGALWNNAGVVNVSAG